MANIREIEGRIRSIQDTMKITNAMYMISSSKLRKNRKSLDDTKEYFFTLQAMIERILRHLPDIDNKYFDLRPQKTGEERIKGLIVVTADKGLAGSYNHNVLKIAQEQIEAHKNCKLFVIGESGRKYFANRGIKVEEQFRYTAQNPTLNKARVISAHVVKKFLDGELDELYIIYTGMKNSIVIENDMLKLLPFTKRAEISNELINAEIVQEELAFMPTPGDVIDNIAPDCVTGYIYGALVESFCSEQNARMMAMEAANKNAQAMIHDLSIQYNRVRQNMITQEITEVIAGARAQKKKKKMRKEVLSDE